MVPLYNLLGLFLLVGSGYAVFYTKSTDNEYPRIGRRAFYTTGSGYPRIGRRSGYLSHSADSSDMGSSAPAEELLSDMGGALDKRGLYTSGRGYPRVGRSGGPVPSREVFQTLRDSLLRKMVALGEEVEREDSDSTDSSELKSKNGSGSELGLSFMFIAFDENGDNQLSKEEFTRGMEKYREENPMC